MHKRVSTLGESIPMLPDFSHAISLFIFDSSFKEGHEQWGAGSPTLFICILQLGNILKGKIYVLIVAFHLQAPWTSEHSVVIFSP